MEQEDIAVNLRRFDLRQMLADFIGGCRHRAALGTGLGNEQEEEEHQQHDIGGLLGDVHRAMDLTLPGLLSEVSAEEKSRWVEVPNSRDWVSKTPRQASRL